MRDRGGSEETTFWEGHQHGAHIWSVHSVRFRSGKPQHGCPSFGGKGPVHPVLRSTSPATGPTQPAGAGSRRPHRSLGLDDANNRGKGNRGDPESPRLQGLEPGDVSPQGVALVTECLERTLELFYRLRGMAPVRDSQPAPATTAVSSDFESRPDLDSDFDSDSDFDPNSDVDFDSDPDTVFDLDSELVDDELADLSNEWPVVPRGRSVEDQADGDTGDQDRSTGAEEPLDRRWGGRLGFDRNVSEDSPVVKGTWVTVSQIVSLIVDGWSWTDILRAHPELTEEDIRTCLAYTLAEEEGDL